MKKVSPFGKFMRMARMDRGLMLLEAAEQLGVSAPMLSMAELGKKKVPTSWADQIVAFLDLNDLEKQKLIAAIEKSNSITEITTETASIHLEAAFSTEDRTDA